MKKLKILNVVIPILMTISSLIVFVIGVSGENELVTWLTMFYALAASIFSYLLYDARDRFDAVVKIADTSKKVEVLLLRSQESQVGENIGLKMKIEEITKHYEEITKHYEEMRKHDAAIIEILRSNNE